jgi:hypothetical protein
VALTSAPLGPLFRTDTNFRLFRFGLSIARTILRGDAESFCDIRVIRSGDDFRP